MLGCPLAGEINHSQKSDGPQYNQVGDHVTEVNQEEQQVEDDCLDKGKTETVFPEITERPKGKRDGEDEVIKPHHEKIIINKSETDQTEGLFSRIDSAKEVNKGQGKADDIQAEENLFGNQRCEDPHEGSQASMGKPIGKGFQPQVVYFLEVVGRVGELAEDQGIIEVAGTILGGYVLKSPYGNEVEQDKAGN